jgi:hypothetical protein
MEDTLEKIRGSLCKDYFCLNKADDDTGIFEAVDSFVELSRWNNTAVKYVNLYPNDEDTGSYDVWDKVGRGVGNFKSLSLDLDQQRGWRRRRRRRCI